MAPQPGSGVALLPPPPSLFLDPIPSVPLQVQLQVRVQVQAPAQPLIPHSAVARWFAAHSFDHRAVLGAPLLLPTRLCVDQLPGTFALAVSASLEQAVN